MTWEFILRLALAGLLGGIIGIDREYRAKEAGLRTHFLVSLGSALMHKNSAKTAKGTLNSNRNLQLAILRIRPERHVESTPPITAVILQTLAAMVCWLAGI